MRGYKVIVRYLPHEVADVEPVLELLQKQDPNNALVCNLTIYLLSMWLLSAGGKSYKQKCLSCYHK